MIFVLIYFNILKILKKFINFIILIFLFLKYFNNYNLII